MKYLIAILFSAGSAFAQQYEMGAGIGYGIYRNGTTFLPWRPRRRPFATASPRGSFWETTFSKYAEAEFDWLYHDGHPFLQSPGVKSDIQGQSDALTVNLLFHFRTRERRRRPCLEGGTGAKDYIIAGPAPFPQPIPQIASLTTNDVWKVVFDVGGGVKYRLMPRMLLRAGFSRLSHDFPSSADYSRAAQYRPWSL